MRFVRVVFASVMLCTNALLAQVATTTTISSSANPASVGQTITFTITVKAASSVALTGPVRIYSNGNPAPDLPLVNGVAKTSVVASAPPRTFQLIATYLGDANSAASTSAPLNQVINATPGVAPTTITVSSSNNPGLTGQYITYTATVVTSGAHAPTGKVSFYTSSTVAQTFSLGSNGKATGSGIFNTAGTFPVTANYSGDSNNSGSTSPVLGQVIQTGGGPSGPQGPYQFIPITPCRIADTRQPTGQFGGPAIGGGQTRTFPIQQSSCGIPATAAAYALNVTAVPKGPLQWLTVWPTGQTLPQISLLNSFDGRVKANAAIVPAGMSGSIDVYAQTKGSTDVVIDINGYFLPATPASLQFYPVTPCRVVDTRNPSGPFGGPYIPAGQSRSFALLSGSCHLPKSAQAYSLNVTALPAGPLSWLTAWPTGETQPLASTLNAPTGTIVANAAIVPAGTNGAVSIFSSNDTDVLVDVNGYFAPPASGGVSLYTVPPCRVVDSRLFPYSPFPGTYDVNVQQSYCNVPYAASAFVLNATVAPPGAFQYLTLFPGGASQPVVSTLNAIDGAITSNMAIVPSSNSVVDAFASDSTGLIVDISSYFAP